MVHTWDTTQTHIDINTVTLLLEASTCHTVAGGYLYISTHAYSAVPTEVITRVEPERVYKQSTLFEYKTKNTHCTTILDSCFALQQEQERQKQFMLFIVPWYCTFVLHY